MNAFVILALVASASAAPSVTIRKLGLDNSGATFQRAPAYDSAAIESHRLGGNFAYITAERHAFASVVPEISEATFPVSETIHTHTPAAIKTVQPGPIVHTTHEAQPIIGQQAVLAQEAVIGPVAAHTQYRQHLVKKQQVHYTQPLAQVHTKTVVSQGPTVAATIPAGGVAVGAVGAVGTVPSLAAYGGYAAGHPALAGANGYLAGYAPGFAGYAPGLALNGYVAGAPALLAAKKDY